MSLRDPEGWQFRSLRAVVVLGRPVHYAAEYSRLSDGYRVEVERNTASGAIKAALIVVANTPVDNTPTLFGEDLDD